MAELTPLLDSEMFFRAVLLTAFAAFQLTSAIANAADLKLPGSEMPLEDAARSSAIFIGEVKKIGNPTLLGPSQPGVSSYLADVQVSRRLVGALPDKVAMTVFTYDFARPYDSRGNLLESPPLAGTSYIFFASSLQGQFTSLKVLEATSAEISDVSKVLASALGSSAEGEWRKFSGSYMKLAAAISKSDLIVVGKIIALGAEVSQPPDAAYAGPLSKGNEVEVTEAIRGSITGRFSFSIFLDITGNEQALVIGKSYILFVQTKGESFSDYPYNCLEKADAENIVIKLLPTAGENVAMVKNLIPK